MWKPKPHWPVVDWLEIVHRANAPREGQASITGLEMIPYLYNFDNLGTKAVIPRVETAPHGVETPVPLADP